MDLLCAARREKQTKAIEKERALQESLVFLARTICLLCTSHYVCSQEKLKEIAKKKKKKAKKAAKKAAA